MTKDVAIALVLAGLLCLGFIWVQNYNTASASTFNERFELKR